MKKFLKSQWGAGLLGCVFGIAIANLIVLPAIKYEATEKV